MKPCVEFYDFFFSSPSHRPKRHWEEIRPSICYTMVYILTLPANFYTYFPFTSDWSNITRERMRGEISSPFSSGRRYESVAVLVSFAVGHLHKIIINALRRAAVTLPDLNFLFFFFFLFFLKKKCLFTSKHYVSEIELYI